MTFIRRTILTIALVGWLTALVAPAVAQQTTARGALDTWIEQINGATDEELRAWTLEAFAPGFLAQVPIEQMMAVSAQLRSLGAFELSAIESETDLTLVARLRTSNGTWLRAQLSLSGTPPKIDGFLIQPAQPPAGAEQPLAWETLDDLAALVAEQADLPGVAIAWARTGEDPHVGVAGLRAIDGDGRIEASDGFHVGSITKSITATALAALVERGELAWSATLAELLPAIEMNPAFGDATLERLLRHRARIPPHLTMNDAEMARLNGLEGTPTEQRAAYVAEVLTEAPGEDGFNYSNAGYAIAGYVGESASGTSWAELIEAEVFEPLGLGSCGVGWPALPDGPDQPLGHYGGPGQRRSQGFDQYQLGAFIEPAGDIHCSVTDLVRYGLAHLAGLSGQDGFLRAATIQELHRTDDVPYAAGWGVDPESGQHRHNGSAGTFYSYLVIDPATEIVIAFLTNAGLEVQPTAERVVREILGREAPR